MASTRQSPQPVTSNETVTLEDSFGELLVDVISEKFKSKIRSGVPELDIPSMDPLSIKKIVLEPTIGGDPYDITLKNIKISGISTFFLKDLTPKLTQLRFRVGILFPKLITDCDYAVNGSVYEVFDVQGTGSAVLEYTDVLLRTTVNLELVNGTLKITTADPPLVDFANTKLTLRSSSGKESEVEQGSSGSNMASELGPLLFWMLADHVVEEVDYYVAKYINEAIKSFKVPDSFKPMVTWLVRRRTQAHNNLGPFHPGFNTLMPLRRFSPISVLGEMVHFLSQVKPNAVFPSAFENLRSSVRSNLRRFL